MPPRASSSTSSNPSAAKKRKTSPKEGSDEPQPPPSPSASYFFEDGNILLQVESTLFKVHKSILTRAEVFADTLLVGSDKQEGAIPTIKVDETMDEWEVFLRAMYDAL